MEKSTKIFSDITFAVISDLHGQSFGRENKRLRKKVYDSHPDAVLIPGDMVVKNGNGKDVCYSLLEKLAKDYPIFYAPGNHEIHLDDKEAFGRKIKELGVHYLENDSAVIVHDDVLFKIFGLSLPEQYYQKFWKKTELQDDDMIKWLGTPKQKYINILLAHNPEFLDGYERWGADVILSGHMHGGIISLWFGGVIAPSLRLFPKYSKGYYRKNNSHLYVSRGLGLHHIKLRFFNVPELVIVTLKMKPDEPIQ